jgi:phage terminase large subunit
MNILYNPAYGEYFSSEDRYCILYGGAGSGKSHAVAQKHVKRCTNENEKHKILVIRKFKTTIEGSVFTLIKSVISDFNIGRHVSVNNTKMQFTFSNGNEIITSGLDDPEKLKSIHGITDIWIEEATELEEEDFQQLTLRLRGLTDSYKQITLTFNPVTKDHWIYTKFFENNHPNTYICWTNYKHNLFLDKEYIEVLEQEFNYDPNMKRIYVDGEWGKERTGCEFYAAFSRQRNVRPLRYNPDWPIHLSFDFNTNPYMPASLWHLWLEDGIYNVGCFELIYLENPRNTTEEVCIEFKERYPDYSTGIFVYGDASGRVKHPTSKRHNYDIIEAELFQYIRSWSVRVPKRNPFFSKRRSFINKCLSGGYPDIRVSIDPSCDLLLADMDNVLQDKDGHKLVKLGKNKAGVPYEKYGHFSDTMDYLLCAAFEDKFLDFGKKIKLDS